MKIVKDKSTLNYTKYSIATIGYFDGIHLGHKKIIKELVNQAKLNGGKSVLITFWPHPKIVLKKDTNIHFLLSKEDKYKFLKNEGIDIIYLIEFTKDFSKVKAEKFIQEYLVKRLKINTKGKDKLITDFLKILKNQEFIGYAYDGAEASFELLARRKFTKFKEFYSLESFKVSDEKRKNSKGINAYIKIILQILFSLMIFYLISISMSPDIRYSFSMPFYKNLIFDIGYFYEFNVVFHFSFFYPYLKFSFIFFWK